MTRACETGATVPIGAIELLRKGDEALAGGRIAAAIIAYRGALARCPELAEAHNNLGKALALTGEVEAAAMHYLSAIEARRDFAEPHNNLGCLLARLGQLGAAIRHYREAIRLDPARPSPYTNLALALHYVPGAAGAALAADAARRWAAALPVRRPPRREPSPPRDGGRLRIGYVSGDFREHPVAYFFEGVLAAHDPSRVETFLYSNAAGRDATSRRLARLAGHWRGVAALSDAALARTIASDRIDILIDLSGHTGGHRLAVFAAKPAPIQCTWLGYVGTTGLAEMDYIIADRFVLPAGDERLFTERPWRLTGSYLCFTPPKAAMTIAPPPVAKSGAVTFGCFNNLLKINGEVVDLWSALLRRLPAARLMLKTALLGNPAIREALTAEFATRGISPDRLTLAPASPREALLDAYNEIDVALDPFPFGGGTTTLEALWMGVPAVTLRSERFAGRVGESILTTLGLPGLVAGTRADYLAKAAALASDPAGLIELRRGLRSRLLASPLLDAARFTCGLEDAFHAMWRARESARLAA